MQHEFAKPAKVRYLVLPKPPLMDTHLVMSICHWHLLKRASVISTTSIQLPTDVCHVTIFAHNCVRVHVYNSLVKSQQMNKTQNLTDYDEDDDWYYAILACQTTVGILLFLLTETGNVLTIVAVVKYRSLQKKQYFFIPSMAAADALLGIAGGLLLIQVEYNASIAFRILNN